MDSGTVRLPKRPFTEDWAQAHASLIRLAALRPELLLPGHGRPLSQPAAALARAVVAERHPRRLFG